MNNSKKFCCFFDEWSNVIEIMGARYTNANDFIQTRFNVVSKLCGIRLKSKTKTVLVFYRNKDKLWNFPIIRWMHKKCDGWTDIYIEIKKNLCVQECLRWKNERSFDFNAISSPHSNFQKFIFNMALTTVNVWIWIFFPRKIYLHTKNTHTKISINFRFNIIFSLYTFLLSFQFGAWWNFIW